MGLTLSSAASDVSASCVFNVTCSEIGHLWRNRGGTQ